MWRKTRTWIPVGFRNRIIGQVKGDPENNRTLWTSQITPFADIDTMLVKLSAGQQWGQIFWSPIATSVVIDNWYDSWGVDGNPQKGDWSGTAKTARQFLASTPGAIYHGGAVSPKLKYLLRAAIHNGESTVVSRIIYDRVLSYDACTMTAANQTMTNTAAATRYIGSTDPGLQVFIEADTAHNSTACNLTALTYTSQAGTAGQAIPTSPTLVKIPSVAAPTTTLAARGVISGNGQTTKNLEGAYMQLAQGDLGVRKLEGFTWSAAPTGTCSFVLQFPLLLLPDCLSASQSSDYTCYDGIEAVNKQVYDDACISFLYCPHVTGQPATMAGELRFGWI